MASSTIINPRRKSSESRRLDVGGAVCGEGVIIVVRELSIAYLSNVQDSSLRSEWQDGFFIAQTFASERQK